MSALRRSSHAVYDIKYHFVWIPKYRKQINRVIVIHTNDLKGAKEARKHLREFYPGKIDIFDAGSALGVHAGERAIGVAFQRA